MPCISVETVLLSALGGTVDKACVVTSGRRSSRMARRVKMGNDRGQGALYPHRISFLKARRKGWRIITGKHPNVGVQVELPEDAISERTPGLQVEPEPVAAKLCVRTAALLSTVENLRTRKADLLAQAERVKSLPSVTPPPKSHRALISLGKVRV